MEKDAQNPKYIYIIYEDGTADKIENVTNFSIDYERSRFNFTGNWFPFVNDEIVIKLKNGSILKTIESHDVVRSKMKGGI